MTEQPEPPSLAGLIDANAQFDLVFSAPRDQLGVLNAMYPDGAATLNRCLPVCEVVAPNAVGFFLTRLRDVTTVHGELLPRCGFGLWQRMLPLELRPPGELQRTRVLLVAVRGRPELTLPPLSEWTIPPAGTDPMAIAERLFPAAKRRLHIFAQAPRAGFISLSPEATWLDPPTLEL